jgi:hypothetical protein
MLLVFDWINKDSNFDGEKHKPVLPGFPKTGEKCKKCDADMVWLDPINKRACCSKCVEIINRR